MARITLVLVDDHPVVLSGLQETLSHEFDVVGVFTKDVEIFAYLKQHAVDVIVTDYMMPENTVTSDGIQYVSYLRRHYPQIGIVVLTSITNPMIIQSLYDIGVSRVLTKETPLNELTRAIKQVAQGRVHRVPLTDITTTLKSLAATTLPDKVKTLSPRESEVLRLFIQGKTVGEIARMLNRSDKTISLQKNAAMRKLGVESNQALITYCVTHRLFD